MGSSPAKPFLHEIEELQRMVELRYESRQRGAAASTNQLLALANARILDDEELKASISKNNVKARERLSWETGRLIHLETILREVTGHVGDDPLLPWGTRYAEAVTLAGETLLKAAHQGNRNAAQVVAKDLHDVLHHAVVRVEGHTAEDVIDSFRVSKPALCPLFAEEVSKCSSESALSFGPCAMEYASSRGVMLHLANSSVHQTSAESVCETVKITGTTLKKALRKVQITAAFKCEQCPAESRQLFCHCWQVVEHVLAKHYNDKNLKTEELLCCKHCNKVTTSKYMFLVHHFLLHREQLGAENPSITVQEKHRAIYICV